MSTVVDLAAGDHAWIEAPIAGAELPARMVMLHHDAERGVRSVLVAFPDGWRRDATGTQPAGEELLVLSGALTISGRTAEPGRMLSIQPRALRSATSVADGTRAVVLFTGPGGGWVDGEELVSGSMELHTLGEGFVRPATEGLHGTVEWHADPAGRTFDGDVEVVWPSAPAYALVPAGEAVPQGPAGPAVVRRLA